MVVQDTGAQLAYHLQQDAAIIVIITRAMYVISLPTDCLQNTNWYSLNVLFIITTIAMPVCQHYTYYHTGRGLLVSRSRVPGILGTRTRGNTIFLHEAKK